MYTHKLSVKDFSNTFICCLCISRMFGSSLKTAAYFLQMCNMNVNINCMQWCITLNVVCVCMYLTTVQGLGTVCPGHNISHNLCCEVHVSEKALINLLTAFSPTPALALPGTAALLLIACVKILIKIMQKTKKITKHCNTQLINTREISLVAKKQCVT